MNGHEDIPVRCIAPCSRCVFEESCRPHLERIILEHAQHGVDVMKAGEDPRFIPRLILACGAGLFTPKRTRRPRRRSSSRSQTR